MKRLTIEEEFNRRVDMYSHDYPLLTREEVTHVLKSDFVTFTFELLVRVKQLEISNRAQQERNKTHDSIN